MLWRLTPSRSHFQLWRTDQSLGLCFGTRTHADKEGEEQAAVCAGSSVCHLQQVMIKNFQQGLIPHFELPIYPTSQLHPALKIGTTSIVVPELCPSLHLAPLISSHITRSHNESLSSSLSALGFWGQVNGFYQTSGSSSLWMWDTLDLQLLKEMAL